MNKVTKHLFTKPDEMEAAISHQAAGITWNIINGIFVLGILWWVVSENSNPIPLLGLLLAEAIYFTVKTFLRWRLTRGGEDNE